MPLHQTSRIIYLITSGRTTSKTTPNSDEFSEILRLVESAVGLRVPLIQLREKSLSARVLYELTTSAVAITQGSETRLLVNDRFDIAKAARADGVHLTSQSLPVEVVRTNCGSEFLIGISTHSLTEARPAQDRGADFVVFGPVFETESKQTYGEPQGTQRLKEVCSSLSGFPVIAIGGIKLENAGECLQAGAAGVAAISLFNDPETLPSVVAALRER